MSRFWPRSLCALSAKHLSSKHFERTAGPDSPTSTSRCLATDDRAGAHSQPYQYPVRGSKRAGRIELGSLLAGLAGGALAAVLLFFLTPGPGRAPDTALPRPAPDLSAIESALARLDQRLANFEKAPRPKESPSERAPVAVPEGEADPLPTANTEELHDELRQLQSRLDMLTQAWKEHDKPSFEVPSIEQVRAARRDVDWAWIGALAELYMKDESAALEKVRLMTFDQLLKRAGVPDKIAHDDGSWMYLRPEQIEGKWRGLYFGFVGDSVSWVRTDK